MNIAVMATWTWVFTVFATMAWGAIEHRAPFLPANAISHIFFGDKAFSEEPVTKYWMSGLALNFAAMISWACVAELGYFLMKAPRGDVGSAAIVSVGTTLLAMIVDFHVVPKRFTPGFERVLSRRALYAVYLTLALGFFLSGLQRV